MKKEQPIPENPSPGDNDLSPEKSFSVAFVQMAQLLRSEVKMKDRATKILLPGSLSFNNSLEQIAKLLRSKAHAAQPSKKRIWKAHPKKK